MVVFCLSPMLLVGCTEGDNLTIAQKVEQIIENTSPTMLEVNDSIMQEYNSSMANSTVLTTSNSYPINMDRNLNESVYSPIQQLTISFGYYALSEYFAQYMQTDFLDKTLYVEQTIYPRQEIYIKFTLNSNSFEIYIYTAMESGFSEFINISIFYDANTYAPTRFVHRENRHWTNNERSLFGHIEVDFTNNNCLIETSAFNPTDASYENLTDEFLRDNLTRYVREKFNFENYKNRETFDSKNLTTDELYSYARNFNYVYEDSVKNFFDFTNLENLSSCDEAMYYPFDKYLILEDENGNLTKIYGDSE